MIIVRVYDPHSRLTYISLVSRLPNKFNLGDITITPGSRPSRKIHIIDLAPITPKSIGIETESSSRGHHEAVCRWDKVVIVLRGRDGIDKSHALIIRKYSRVLNPHVIYIVCIRGHGEIRDCFSHIHTVVEFLASIRVSSCKL